MASLDDLPYHELVFDEDGALNTTDHQEHPGLQAAVAAGGVTDVFVFSHGWNNGVASARALYAEMFTLLRGQLGATATTSRFVGVLWPSLLFPDDDPATPTPEPSTGRQLAAAIARAMPQQRDQLDVIGQLLDDKPEDRDKLVEFHSLTTGLVTTVPQAKEDAGESTLPTADALTVLGRAATMAPGSSPATRSAGNVFDRLWAGGRELLRTASYYEMKNPGRRDRAPWPRAAARRAHRTRRCAAHPPDRAQLRRPAGLLLAGGTTVWRHWDGQPDQVAHADPGSVLALRLCPEPALRPRPDGRTRGIRRPGGRTPRGDLHGR